MAFANIFPDYRTGRSLLRPNPYAPQQGIDMASQKVSKAQMLGLLGRLANDEGYRERFEENPSAALAEIGIPPDQIKGFPEDHTRPGKLALKSDFEAARKHLANQVGAECLCMIIPGLRLDFGDHN